MLSLPVMTSMLPQSGCGFVSPLLTYLEDQWRKELSVLWRGKSNFYSKNFCTSYLFCLVLFIWQTSLGFQCKYHLLQEWPSLTMRHSPSLPSSLHVPNDYSPMHLGCFQCGIYHTLKLSSVFICLLISLLLIYNLLLPLENKHSFFCDWNIVRAQYTCAKYVN